MNYETIKYEVKDKIGVITLNRADALNALSSKMVRELAALVREIEHDSQVWVVILTGGKTFSAGADIREKDRPPTYLSELNDMFNSFENLPKPVIAVLTGYAVGGGCEFALACDMRVAALDAKIGLPELKISSVPAAGGTFRLPRLIGEVKAKELIFLGNSLNGSEALAIGLVNRAVPAEKVMDEAMQLARTLTERPPLAVRAAKLSIQHSRLVDNQKGIEIVLKMADEVRLSKDNLEGKTAFAEKRKPVWQGK